MALTPEEEAKFRLMMASYDSGKTIPQMPVATGLDGTELVEVIQNSASSKSTINDIISLVDSYYVGASATKIVKDATNSTIAKSDFLGNQIDLTYARKDELSGWSIGDIKLHFGSLAGIGADWRVCDGETYNGVKTPDMGGKYAIGYKESSPATPVDVDDDSENYGAIGNTCGSNTHVLTILESPTHFHNSVAKTSRQTADTLRNSADGSILAAAATGEVAGDDNNAYQLYAAPGGNIPVTGKSSNVGGGAPHSSRPDSVVLAYIMKIA